MTTDLRGLFQEGLSNCKTAASLAQLIVSITGNGDCTYQQCEQTVKRFCGTKRSVLLVAALDVLKDNLD
jgi:hypothetical protein